MLFYRYAYPGNETPHKPDVNIPQKILVTGSRKWDSRKAIENAFAMWRLTSEDTLIHGDARGADKLAATVATEMGLAVIAVPAEWKTLGRRAGMLRNQKMLNMEPDFVFAFHEDLPTSKGTKDMVRRARMAGHKRVYLFLPDGTCVQLKPISLKEDRLEPGDL